MESLSPVLLYQEIIENIYKNPQNSLISFHSIYYLIKILENTFLYSAKNNKVLFFK